MDDRIEKQTDENRIEAGRGVPLEQASSDQKIVSSEVNSESNERLDDRIRKAGI